MGLADLKKAEAIVSPILEEMGCELVQIRYLSEQGRAILRLLIDREGGVTISDCHRVSREVETILEVEGVVRGPYTLEVSSPGVERPLVREADFVRFAGRRAYLKTRIPREGRQNFRGLLGGFEAGEVVMVDDEGRQFRIPLKDLEKAHLIYTGEKNDVSRSHSAH